MGSVLGIAAPLLDDGFAVFQKFTNPWSAKWIAPRCIVAKEHALNGDALNRPDSSFLRIRRFDNSDGRRPRLALQCRGSARWRLDITYELMPAQLDAALGIKQKIVPRDAVNLFFAVVSYLH